MPELLHRLATTNEAPAPTTPDPAPPGKQTRTADLPAAAAPSQSAVSRVKAYAGETLRDGGGFSYLVRDAGTFEVTGAPPSSSRSIGRVITPDGKLAKAWMALAQRLFARLPVKAAAPAASVTTTPVTTPAQPEPPRESADLLPSLAPILDAIEEAATPIGRFLTGLFGDSADADAPADAPAPTAPTPAPAPANENANVAPAAPNTAVDANLTAATALAAATKI